MLKPKLRRPSFGRRGRWEGGGYVSNVHLRTLRFASHVPVGILFIYSFFFLLGPSPLCFVCHHINCHIAVFRPVDCRNVTPKEPNTRFLKQTKLLYLTSLFCLLNFIFNPISSLAPLPVELQDKHCVRISKRSVLQETLRPQAYATRSQRQVMTS